MLRSQSVKFSSLVIFFALALLVPMACASPRQATPTPIPESMIPPHFTSYLQDQEFFSISYPQDWETALSLLAELEDATKELLRSTEPDLPLEKVRMVFFAGKPMEEGFDPNVTIIVESLDVSSLDEAAEVEIRGVKSVSSDYRSYTEVKTVVGGREAVIFDHEYTVPGAPRYRSVQMIILDGKLVWIVTCGTSPDRFVDVEETCNQTVRSFRITR